MFEDVKTNHFWEGSVLKLKDEDGLVEEEIDKFNNGNNVKLNNSGDDFIEYKHKRVSLQFQMQQKCC